MLNKSIGKNELSFYLSSWYRNFVKTPAIDTAVELLSEAHQEVSFMCNSSVERAGYLGQ